MINGSTLHFMYEKEIQKILDNFQKQIEDESLLKHFFKTSYFQLASYQTTIGLKERVDLLFDLLKKRFDSLYGDSFILEASGSYDLKYFNVKLKNIEL